MGRLNLNRGPVAVVGSNGDGGVVDGGRQGKLIYRVRVASPEQNRHLATEWPLPSLARALPPAPEKTTPAAGLPGSWELDGDCALEPGLDG